RTSLATQTTTVTLEPLTVAATAVTETTADELLDATLNIGFTTGTSLSTLVDTITNIVRATERVIKYGLSATPRPVERTLKDKRRELELER
ncbi:MAG TPA: hypothetical protein VKP88_01395, partial [Candidatus Paceibacterota bacterium]|nr:hypothetical protein [Candidatus Paceibacterota bacterium]